MAREDTPPSGGSPSTRIQPYDVGPDRFPPFAPAMSLGTILTTAMTLPGLPAAPAPQRLALVLMGGGARTAYQAGVLLGINRILGRTARSRFDLLVGTSAGALNATFLAAHAGLGSDASHRLAEFWLGVRSHHVYRTAALPWAAPLRWATLLSAGWTLRRQARSLLDNTPLAETLRQGIPFDAVGRALAVGQLQGLAVTASSYTTGVHWTFCQLADPRHRQPWQRAGRQASHERITVRHLLASSAIPFIFPGVPLQVGTGAALHTEFFGDGSMRQLSPLSPAMHLGATHILAIGVAQPQRAGLGQAPGQAPAAPTAPARHPPLAQVASHAMASVFHDTLEADVEQTRRVNQSLKRLQDLAPGAALPYRPVRVLALQPSESLDALALTHLDALPAPALRLLKALGGASGAGAALASYLLFEPPFVQALIALGERDALQRRAEIEDFFADVPHAHGRHVAVP